MEAVIKLMEGGSGEVREKVGVEKKGRILSSGEGKKRIEKGEWGTVTMGEKGWDEGAEMKARETNGLKWEVVKEYPTMGKMENRKKDRL